MVQTLRFTLSLVSKFMWLLNKVNQIQNQTQALKFVLERAKQAQVPKHVIDKAIDKAKGNTDETFAEGRYEGFGPNGSMIIVDTLTSNVNRTAANVRTAFGKTVVTWVLLGSVSYMFDKKGVIVFAGEDADAIFEQLLEADVEVEDVEAEDGTITVYTEPTDLHKALKLSVLTDKKSSK